MSRTSTSSLLRHRPDLTLVLTPDTVEVMPVWHLAAESGHWYESWKQKGDFTELRGTYYATWKLSDGRWRLKSQLITPLSCKGVVYCVPE